MLIGQLHTRVGLCVLLVQQRWAMRRPQNVERAAVSAPRFFEYYPIVVGVNTMADANYMISVLLTYTSPSVQKDKGMKEVVKEEQVKVIKILETCSINDCDSKYDLATFIDTIAKLKGESLTIYEGLIIDLYKNCLGNSIKPLKLQVIFENDMPNDVVDYIQDTLNTFCQTGKFTIEKIIENVR